MKIFLMFIMSSILAVNLLYLNWGYWMLHVLPNIFFIFLVTTVSLVCYVDCIVILKLCKFLYYNTRSYFKVLHDFIVIDFLNRNVLRFELIVILFSLLYNVYLSIRCYLMDNNTVNSLSSIYGNSIFFECEIWDMFGLIITSLKKNIYHIFLDFGFCGYPLRKDFSISGYIQLKYSFLKTTLDFVKSFYLNMRLHNLVSSWAYGY